ncbi:hypothetical protein CGCSCA1_v004671 [Colletotrichum siamense]|nr:hypothetical protein CGCSCA1_v004671 [Colletotrichum siamense]
MLQVAGPVTRVRLIGYAGRHSGTILCSRANNLKETHVTLDVSSFPVSSQCPSQVSLNQIWFAAICILHLRRCAVGCLVSSHPSRFRPNATESPRDQPVRKGLTQPRAAHNLAPPNNAGGGG